MLTAWGCERDTEPEAPDPVKPIADVVSPVDIPPDTAVQSDSTVQPDVPAPLAEFEIVIDGLAGEWAEVPTAAPGIKIANDADRLLLLIELDDAIALDESPLSPILLIDADLDASTGSPQGELGVELFWSFGQRSGTAFAAGSSSSVQQADIGLLALPTVSAKRFEVALLRHPQGAAPALDGTLRLKLGGHRFDYTLDSALSAPPKPLDTAQVRDSVRVMTWNMLADGLLQPDRQDAFRTVLLEMRPDVIAFQEVYSGPEAVRARIENILLLPDGEAWTAHGFQGRVIVSRYPITAGWPDDFDTLSSRFEVAAIELPQGPSLVLVNGHMSCCDNDSARLDEAISFATWVDDLITPGGAVDIAPSSPIVLTGDLNLVGSAAPLDVLLTAPDWSGGTLVDLVSRHADAPLAYTWRYPSGSFWPGRLDYVIYSSDALTAARHFVVGESEATFVASDHLPVVVDFVLKAP